MTNYRRNRVPGATYCFTINLENRESHLLTNKIDLLRAAIRKVLHARPFHVDAWVILPDHMHCLWTLPENDTDYATRLRLIKTHFSKSIPLAFPRTQSQIKRNERGLWQRRFWEHTIRNDADYAAHMDYIHFNPVKHALAPSPAAWPYSTFQAHVRRGLYPPTWSTEPPWKSASAPAP